MIYSNYVLANGTLLMNLKGRGISEADSLACTRAFALMELALTEVCRFLWYVEIFCTKKRKLFGGDSFSVLLFFCCERDKIPNSTSDICE